MEVSLGYLYTPENILIRKFSTNKEFLGEDSISFDELKSNNIDGLLVSFFEPNEELLEILKEENNFFPINNGLQFSLTFEDFKKINPLMALNKLRDLNATWALKNNLILIENLFETISTLKKNLHKDREQFLTDLWYLFKNNLGAFAFTLYFNDVEETKKQIIKKKIFGKKNPEFFELSELDFKILKTLDEIPGTINFFQEKNEFFIRMEILGSPVLMVGGCFSFTPLQKSIIKSLIKDLV